MSRFQLVRALLIAGAVLGFTSGFMHLRHHRLHHGHAWSHPHCGEPAAPAPR
jgi:hypothetical protein